MNLNKFSTTLAAVGLVSTLLFSGCQGGTGAKLSVGKVDTAVLLQDDPDYQTLSIEYIREQTDLRKKFVDQMKAIGDDETRGKKLQEELKKTQEAFEKRWATKTEDFLKARHTSIQDTAGEIAQRKNIDMVIIDSKMYPTVEWGGVDMTKDMALALSTSESTATPDASSTPEEK